MVSNLMAVPFALLASAITGTSMFDFAQNGTIPITSILITSVGSVLAATFTAPVRAGIDALLYVDLRMRKEGLDIVLQQAAARQSA
jgi:hypothetical protein